MNRIFETDFDAEAVCAAPGPGGSAAGEAEARDAAMRSAAYEEGYAAGLAAARADAGRDLHDLLGAVSREVGTLHAGAASHRAAMEAQALDFARAACERIAPELVAALGSDRAAAEVRRCLGLVVGSARIEVTLSPTALERHGDSLGRTLEAAGPDGRVRLQGDPSLADGDVRMRWEDGGMTYSMDDALGGLIGALRRHAALADWNGRTSHG